MNLVQEPIVDSSMRWLIVSRLFLHLISNLLWLWDIFISSLIAKSDLISSEIKSDIGTLEERSAETHVFIV